MDYTYCCLSNFIYCSLNFLSHIKQDVNCVLETLSLDNWSYVNGTMEENDIG